MPAVDPATSAGSTTAAAPLTDAPSADAPAPGFAAILARAGDGGRLTLGEMVGLDPVPPGGLGLGTAGPAGTIAFDLGGQRGDTGAHPVVDAASEYLGVPYRWGGTDPETGLDCSGLVQRAFADLGIDVPRVSADQARAGTAVDSLEEARPGDLVYWAGRGGRPNHIGIYLGDGQMLHAPRTGDVVKVDDVRTARPDAIRRID